MKNVGKTVSVNEVMDALADIQRRKLLIALLAHNPRDDGPVVIADSESDSDDVEWLRLVVMRQVHLPTLADYGFIQWNEDTHEVLQGPNFDKIRPHLELLDDHEDELPDDWL